MATAIPAPSGPIFTARTLRTGLSITARVGHPRYRPRGYLAITIVKSPQLAGGDAGGIPLCDRRRRYRGICRRYSGYRPTPTALRGTICGDSRGVDRSAATGCNDWDTRDSGYLGAWLALAAEFDPDPVQQANWQTQLGQLLIRDQKCKGADNSWANGFLWNNASVPLNMTNGSPVATGANIPPAICFGIASGTMSVVNGSATGMGSGFRREANCRYRDHERVALHRILPVQHKHNGTITMARSVAGRFREPQPSSSRTTSI